MPEKDSELLQNLKKLKPQKPKIPLERDLSDAVHAGTPQSSGVYALWDKDVLLYIGYSRTNEKPRSGIYAGIKARLHSHRLGGGSFGIALFMQKIAPTPGPKDWEKFASGEQVFFKSTQDYIRTHVKYTYLGLDDPKTAKEFETYAQKMLGPKLNRYIRKGKKLA